VNYLIFGPIFVCQLNRLDVIPINLVMSESWLILQEFTSTEVVIVACM